MKLILFGIWAVLVSVGTFMGLSHFNLFAATSSAETSAPKIESMSTGLMRVPIMAGEVPKGYVLLDLEIDYDSQPIASIAGKFQGIAVDEAFRAVYESVSVDFNVAKKTDLSALLTTIGENLNKRVGLGTVKEVRIKEFMFVPPRSGQKNHVR